MQRGDGFLVSGSGVGLISSAGQTEKNSKFFSSTYSTKANLPWDRPLEVTPDYPVRGFPANGLPAPAREVGWWINLFREREKKTKKDQRSYNLLYWSANLSRKTV